MKLAWRVNIAGGMKLAGVVIIAGGLVLAGVASASQRSPRVGMLEQDAWAAMKAGKPQAALEAFREAIRLEPRNPMLRLGAGAAEIQLRHDAEAKAHFEQALILDPSLTVARAQLAQVIRRQGDLNEAIRQYEIVAAEAANDPGVRGTLERWKRERELHERMRLEVGNFFTVSYEGEKDAAMAAQALESLDKAYWRICDVFGAFPTKSVPVVLYTGEQFEDVTRSPKWAAAAYDGIIRVPMRGAGEKGEDLDRVLAHEFTHALVRSLATRGLPTWLNEGLASVLESDTLDWATDRVAELERVPSLTVLAPPFGKLSGGDAQIAYAVSAVAAKRLLDDAGGIAIANLLRDLGNGAEFEAAFLHRIQKSLAEFEANLKR
jgi:tetratricopeptide (TPR) repeat protein